jgi:hypothetical protein
MAFGNTFGNIRKAKGSFGIAIVAALAARVGGGGPIAEDNGGSELGDLRTADCLVPAGRGGNGDTCASGGIAVRAARRDAAATALRPS